MARLFHVSDDPHIATFVPRPSEIFPNLGPVVWAVDEPHLPNYLLPRDCPRITFEATNGTSAADRERFGARESGRVVIIETTWLPVVNSATLHLYELPTDPFELNDQSAGYWVSRAEVVPRSVSRISDLPTAIVKRGAELRIVKSLWELHDEVTHSTLNFSIIRMRNAER